MRVSGVTAALVAAALTAVAVVTVPLGAAAATPLYVAVGSAPRIPAGAVVVGPQAASAPTSVAIVLSPRDAGVMAAVATAVSTPGSPQFHHFLTPGAVRSLFAPGTPEVHSVESWLSSGLHVAELSGDGLLVSASGTAADVERVLGVHLVRYRLASGRVVVTNTSPPRVPAGIAPSIAGIYGLDNLVQGHSGVPGGGGHPGEGTLPRPATPTGGPVPCTDALNSGGATADELGNLYGLNSLYSAGRFGQGVTVGLFEEGDYQDAAITKYERCYKTSTTVTRVPVDGGNSSVSGETTLDIEDVAGVAPGTTILVYEAPGRNFSLDALEEYAAIAQQNQAQVVSSSWGFCEPDQSAQNSIGVDNFALNESFFFQEMALQGQSMFAASGDEGSEDCDTDATIPPGPPYPSYIYNLNVDDPASQPFVTGVGGTQIPDNTQGAASQQKVWNLSGVDGLGGGFVAPFNGVGAEPKSYPGNLVSTGGISVLWPQPQWQAGFDTSGNSSGTPCSAPAGTMCREVPDVSALAGPPGYAITSNDGSKWGGYDLGGGGTSAASPLWASVAAIAAQGAPAKRLGQLNPSLYALYRSNPSGYTDIVTGENNYLAQGGMPDNYTCTYNGVANQPCYKATPGFDMTSGLGTPVGAALVAGLDHMAQSAAGYSIVASDGASAQFSSGNTATLSPTIAVGGPIVAVAGTPDAGGYWAVRSDGTVVPFGDARHFGSPSGRAGSPSVTGIATTPDGAGYWLASGDGGVYAYGDAKFSGSMGGQHVSGAVIGISATPDGAGYWLAGSDGSVYAFGSAAFYGSLGGHAVASPIVGITATPDGGGYWLAGSDGSVYAFGSAAFYGSLGGHAVASPIVGITATPDGGGYWLLGADGGVFTYGDAGFRGSATSILGSTSAVGLLAG